MLLRKYNSFFTLGLLPRVCSLLRVLVHPGDRQGSRGPGRSEEGGATLVISAIYYPCSSPPLVLYGGHIISVTSVLLIRHLKKTSVLFSCCFTTCHLDMIMILWRMGIRPRYLTLASPCGAFLINAKSYRDLSHGFPPPDRGT